MWTVLYKEMERCLSSRCCALEVEGGILLEPEHLGPNGCESPGLKCASSTSMSTSGRISLIFQVTAQMSTIKSFRQLVFLLGPIVSTLFVALLSFITSYNFQLTLLSSQRNGQAPRAEAVRAVILEENLYRTNTASVFL